VKAVAILVMFLAACAVDAPASESTAAQSDTAADLDAYYQTLIDTGHEELVPCTWHCRCECDPPPVQAVEQ